MAEICQRSIAFSMEDLMKRKFAPVLTRALPLCEGTIGGETRVGVVRLSWYF